MKIKHGQTEKISSLLGLGPKSEKMLNAAGINTVAHLRRLGALRAYTRVLETGQKVSLNLLWALAGGLSNTHWARLPPEERSALLRQYDAWCDARTRHP
jgi:DNA transformation protein